MSKMNKNRKKWITLLVLTLVMGVILVLSVSEFFEREGGISFDGMIRAETLYIIIIFLILIPVLLGILLAVMLFGKNKESEYLHSNSLGFASYDAWLNELVTLDKTHIVDVVFDALLLAAGAYQKCIRCVDYDVVFQAVNHCYLTFW